MDYIKVLNRRRHSLVTELRRQNLESPFGNDVKSEFYKQRRSFRELHPSAAHPGRSSSYFVFNVSFKKLFRNSFNFIFNTNKLIKHKIHSGDPLANFWPRSPNGLVYISDLASSC
ncbi:hypothetical protein Avbf_00370 [Armadillidium vulgare]|nr:hypothetical protein Avbf_00370 [Armadillidium vulgare]